jgi:hypothetical protein
MPRTRLLLLVLFALAPLALLLGVAHPSGDRGPKSTFSLEQARGFTDFPVYYAGDVAAGAPLVAVLRRNDTANYVSFIYGECVATNESGCAPTAEVQVWPACRRNPSMYLRALSAMAPDPRATSVRGVPAAFFEDGTRLEIQTATSTVVVFAATRETVTSISRALRGVNTGVRAGQSLPKPAAGALDGTLKCGG